MGANKKYVTKEILLHNISTYYINILFSTEYLITDDWVSKFMKNYQKISKYNKLLNNNNLNINLYLSNILVDLYERPEYIIEFLKNKIKNETDDISIYKDFIINEICKK